MCVKTVNKFYLESYWIANLHVQLVIYGCGSSLLSIMVAKFSIQNAFSPLTQFIVVDTVLPIFQKILCFQRKFLEKNILERLFC